HHAGRLHHHEVDLGAARPERLPVLTVGRAGPESPDADCPTPNPEDRTRKTEPRRPNPEDRTRRTEPRRPNAGYRCPGNRAGPGLPHGPSRTEADLDGP